VICLTAGLVVARLPQDKSHDEPISCTKIAILGEPTKSHLTVPKKKWVCHSSTEVEEE